MKNHKNRINSEAAEVAAKRMADSERKSGKEPEELFIENNAFLFRKPNWTDVENMLYVRLMSSEDASNTNTPLVLKEIGDDDEG